MFSLNEKIVYPGHGVAKVNRIIEKMIVGQKATFYELTFLSKDVTVLVPTENSESVGIRPLSSTEHIKEILLLLAQEPRKLSYYEFTASNWNKRNKEYQHKLRTGSLKDLTEIYRDLRHISMHKELSFGEKNLLAQTEALLVEEIALVEQRLQERIIEQLRLLSAPVSMRSSPISQAMY